MSIILIFNKLALMSVFFCFLMVGVGSVCGFCKLLIIFGKLLAYALVLWFIFVYAMELTEIRLWSLLN